MTNDLDTAPRSPRPPAAGPGAGGPPGGRGGDRSPELLALDALLERLGALPADDPQRVLAERSVSYFVRQSRGARRRADRARAHEADRRTARATATGAADRADDVPLRAAGTAGTYERPQCCYVCKAPYRRADAFYHRLCPQCAADNAERRGMRTDLRGRRALLTGGRVKIGFELALMMLRDGADLTVTSRFPADTLRRFRAVPGSGAWEDRLAVVGIDLRDPRQVLGFCDELLAQGRPLDILVNNAAQTIRRPPQAYALLTAGEPDARSALPPGVRRAPGFETGAAVAWPRTAAGPELAAPDAGAAVGLPDAAGLLPDTAAVNSWSQQLGSLVPAESLEAYLVNAFAPLLLCDRLLPLLLASPHERRYVVNVSAVEGRFAVEHKTDRHPHTNMAKAALNMLTRTSGPRLAERGVHMCAVDTGWVTDENPAPQKSPHFRTPLDVTDGAARVYDPIVRGESGTPLSGVFLKDYGVAAW